MNHNRSLSKCQRGHPFDAQNTYINPKSGKRTCRACQTARNRHHALEPGVREQQKQHMRDWRAANPERNRKTWTDNRKRKRDWVLAYKAAQGCKCCSEKDPVCLDFHHRDPSKKDFLISLAIARASMERIQAEVEKCDVLCANCHRKHHAYGTVNSVSGRFPHAH